MSSPKRALARRIRRGPQPPARRQAADRAEPPDLGGVHELLLREEDRWPRDIALLVTLLLHILMITVTVPSFRVAGPVDTTPKRIVYVSRWVPPPPRPPQVRQRLEQQDLQARRIPVPDPTPDEPEPVREPEPEPEPIPIPPDVEIIIGAPEPPPLQEAPVRAGFGGVTYPVLIASTRVPPVYPELARKAKVEGSVILEAVIRKDGAVGNVRVLRSPGQSLGFEEAAILAVRQWRYKPGVQDGRPVDVYFTVIVEFVLE